MAGSVCGSAALPQLPPEEPPEARLFASDLEAVRFIQKRWRTRHARKMLASFPSLEKLRSMYIDEKAARAGAADSKWYTSLALAAREHVRQSKEVADFCDEAWTAITQAARHGLGENAKEDAMASGLQMAEVEALAAQARSELDGGLNKEAYVIMARKLYLVAKLQENDDDLDKRDMFETAEDDWEDDTQGALLLTEAAFKRCWFQLVDLYTENINAEEYAQWASDTLNTITRVHPQTGTRVWRDDADILRLFEPRETPNEQRAFEERVSSWTIFFEPPKLSVASIARAAVQRQREDRRRSTAIARRQSVEEAQRRTSCGEALRAFHSGGSSASQRRISGAIGAHIPLYMSSPFVEPLRNLARSAKLRDGSGTPSRPLSSGGSRRAACKAPRWAAPWAALGRMFGSDLQTHHRTSFVDDMDCILVQGIDCIVYTGHTAHW